jgi:ParB family chromosome partitioning protein
LQLLAKRGAMAKNAAIACQVVASDAAAEASLAENVQHVAMNAMDEFEAFAGLIENGHSVEDVARRFGCPLRKVEQRLALGRLSPKIRAAYRKRDLTLAVAEAFAITDSHAAQERVFKQMHKPITHAQSVRQALTQSRLAAADKLVKFVGLDAYEAAGGRIVRDLFEDDAAFLDNSDLLHRLAFERIEKIRDQILAEGWGWAEAHLGHGSIEGCAGERLHAKAKRLSAPQRQEIATLEAAIAAIDARLEAENGDETALWEERECAEARLDALRAASMTWDPKQMAYAGASIAIDHAGKPAITRGLIKRADMRALDKLRNIKPASAKNGERNEHGGADPSGPHLTKSLSKRLTQARTRGLRTALTLNPNVALALVVHVLLRASASRKAIAGVGLAAKPVAFEDNDECERRRIACAADAPEDEPALFAACLAMPTDRLLSALAVLLAETVDFTHEDTNRWDRDKQVMSDALAAALDLDMTKFWEPDRDFFAACPKPMTIAALQTAPAIAKLGEAERAGALAAFAKMKKSELAGAAAHALRDTGWLPELLLTPARAGAAGVAPAPDVYAEAA